MASQHSGDPSTSSTPNAQSWLQQAAKPRRASYRPPFLRFIVLAVALGLLQLCAAQVSSDPDDNPKGTFLPSTMTAGSPFTWCDYNCDTLVAANGAFNISMSTKEGPKSGSRIHTAKRYAYGNFSAMVKCPKGDITGLLPNFYTSSRETAGINSTQDEIDFEWLGKNKTIVQVNFYVDGNHTSFGADNAEIIDLGFDCSDDFHEYRIDWTPIRIKWFIDGRLVRTSYNRTGFPYPTMPSFVYSSIWDASGIDNGSWAGAPNSYRDAPFVFQIHSVKATELANITFNDNATTTIDAPLPLATPPSPATPRPSRGPSPTRVPSAPLPPSPPAQYPGEMDAAAATQLIVPLIVVSVVLLLLGGGFTWVVIKRKRVFAATDLEGSLVAGKAAGGDGGGTPPVAQTEPSRAKDWLRQLSARISMKRDDLRKGSFTRIEL